MERLVGTVALVSLLYAGIAGAQHSNNEGMPNLLFDAYGTVGVVHSNEDRADFVNNNLTTPEGAGYTDPWSAEVDTRLGLQFTAEITPKLSGVIQVVMEQRYDDTWTPTLEWANFKYQISPDLNVRVGRTLLSNLLISDYRKVGYSVPWVRPPSEIYNLSPPTNIDGVEASYRFHIGRFLNTVRLNYGQNIIDLPGGGESEARKLWAVTGTSEWGATTLLLGYSRANLTQDGINVLFNAFRQFGPQGVAIADRYDLDDKLLELINIGARYDPGDWFIMGEWAQSQSRSFVSDGEGWYISGGYRFGPVTPYLTLAKSKVNSNTSDPGLALTNLPPPLAGAAQGLNIVLNGLLSSGAVQKSIAVGARWDFAANFALKVQYDYVDLGAGSAGFLINEQPGFNRGGSVSLFSATIDFVF